jgi:hypothetical protein
LKQSLIRLPIWSIMIFPALFTAGMALIDTTDSLPGASGPFMLLVLRRQQGGDKARHARGGGTGGDAERRVALMRHGGEAAASGCSGFVHFGDLGLHHQRDIRANFSRDADGAGDGGGQPGEGGAMRVPGGGGNRQRQSLLTIAEAYLRELIARAPDFSDIFSHARCLAVEDEAGMEDQLFRLGRNWSGTHLASPPPSKAICWASSSRCSGFSTTPRGKSDP